MMRGSNSNKDNISSKSVPANSQGGSHLSNSSGNLGNRMVHGGSSNAGAN